MTSNQSSTQRRGPRVWALAAMLGATMALGLTGIALAEKPTTVKAGNLVLTLNGGVTPKALSKKTMEPIALNVSGKIGTADGTHPPALTSATVLTDKNGTLDARGVPTCEQGQLEARTTAEAKKVCKDAIVGTGTTDVELLFAESKPVLIHSQLTAFNGGGNKGSATIYIHAFLSNPISAALVTTVKVSKSSKGPYGTKALATIPKIANGDGSVTAFNLTFAKKLFAFKGQKHGYLLARCATGKFLAEATAKFANGDQLGPAKITRACTPKG
jgi:hypothetical protein